MKKQLLTQAKCTLGIFVIGGAVYNLIEILWRGYTHWSMFLVGGACFQIIGRIHTWFRTWSIARRCFLCSVAITVIEYCSGCLFNLKMKLNVWDYTDMPFNLHGQVCLLYSVLWGGLSLIAQPAYRLFHHKLTTGSFFPVKEKGPVAWLDKDKKAISEPGLRSA